MDFKLNHSSNFTKAVIVLELLVVSYLLYTLTVSVYKSYQIDQHILSYRQENERLALQIKQKEQDSSYYNSEAFQEKIAKQNMNLSIPGEEVVIVLASDDKSNGLAGGTSNNGDDTQVKLMSNTQKWWQFFFGFQNDVRA